MASEQIGLETHLRSIIPDGTLPSLRQDILPKLLQSIEDVSKVLRNEATVSQVGTANAFGDDQLNVDVLAEKAIRSAISKCPSIVTASSEEDPVERSTSSPSSKPASENEEVYTLAFDPLDGSSIIAPNWTVGTIMGLWQSSTALKQDPSKQIAAILGVLGPRTTAVVALRIPGCQATCFEVAYGSQGEIQVVKPNIQLHEPPFKTRYFAPANLRAAAYDQKYMSLINHFITQAYTLRYCGGLVPDIVHTLVKGHGVYVNPVSEKSKPKLRRLYELLPIALIIECAGGLAAEVETGKSILSREVQDTDERGGLVCGTKEEVELVLKMLIG
ncbi:carbohydrate phosphatase [Periconia macrospinosa]|uniref:Carbohydrate phosphatase n=1 Tax=Periconia macrospinosa TaxID=97972 RepID=A0A2V1DLY0_9PLEO|nr:carbohydrate phosphatase [Periconia macrospinosa]